MTRLFGTNGVRGIVNEEMTVELASSLSQAIGTFFGRGTVAIGGDTRTSTDMLKGASISGLLSAGCDVVDLGVLPTPTLQYAVNHGEYVGGVIITASHNPPEFNGIKCVDAQGMELPKKSEEEIEEIYFGRKSVSAEWDRLGTYSRRPDAIDAYLKGILEKADGKAVKKAKLKVVVDCGNGTTCFVSPLLLRKLGCRVITINGQPDGTFPGHDSEPTRGNLRDLMDVVKDSGADLGLAHDGDGDRTIFVDEKGRFVDGDKSLALVSKRIVLERGGGLVVTPVSSSSCVEEAVVNSGGRVIYTKVGSPIVARVMLERGAIFGGEENGGLIFPEHQYCRDGSMTAAKVVEILAKTGRKMSELTDEIPQYFLYKSKTGCPNERKREVLSQFVERYQGRKTDLTDGVKVYFENGWVLCRPSGTEPIFRVFAESKDRGEAQELAEKALSVLRELIATEQGK